MHEKNETKETVAKETNGFPVALLLQNFVFEVHVRVGAFRASPFGSNTKLAHDPYGSMV